MKIRRGCQVSSGCTDSERIESSNTTKGRVRLVILIWYSGPQAKGDFDLRMNYALNSGFFILSLKDNIAYTKQIITS